LVKKSSISAAAKSRGRGETKLLAYLAHRARSEQRRGA
jgi:hypothetical protein